MKRLWLVGESLPLKEDGTSREARKTTNLPETLTPLDPRHGVFPNLVMKPLFSAGFVMSKCHGDKLSRFFEEIAVAVQDSSHRRFNVFMDRPTKKKKRQGDTVLIQPSSDSDVFEIDKAVLERVTEFDQTNDLWLMFGHQTTFGFLYWLTSKRRPFRVTRSEVRDFSENFARTVSQIAPEYDCGRKSQLSRRIGLLHRLCTGARTTTILERAISKLEPNAGFTTNEIVALIRGTIPLLHNEGYQDGSNPTGNAQDHFAKQAKGKSCDGDLYWQVMGDAVATRLLGQFVE